MRLKKLGIRIVIAGLTCLLSLSVTATSVMAASTQDDWPTSLHDLSRDASSTDTTISTSNVTNLAPAWTYQTGGVIPATATVTGGVAYFGSWDGYEYALNATTGSLIWKQYLGVTQYNSYCIPSAAGVSSPPTVQNGVVYVGGGDSYWYALNAATGAVEWKVYTGNSSAAGGNYNWSGPLIYNGYAYIGVASLGDCPLVQGQLLKVNLATHQVENTLNIVPNGQIGGGIWTSPALDPATGTIYTATGTKNDPTQHEAQALLAINSSTMEITDHWELPNSDAVLDSDFGTSTILFTDSQGRQLVAAINKNGDAYAFLRNNLAAGPVWSVNIAGGGDCPTCGQSSVSSAAFGNGLLYMAGGSGQIGTQGYDGTVRAINPATGQFVWQHPTSGTVIGALAYANGLVYVSAGNVLEVLNAATGHTLYSYNTGAQLYGGPSIADGHVYVGTVTGTMYAFALGSPGATPPPDSHCPSGYTCQDVGNVAATGSENVVGGTWAVAASGGGLAGTQDSFRLLTEPDTVDGNVQVSAQVTAETQSDQNMQAGVILRASNRPNAPFYAVMVKPNNTVVVQVRQTVGGTASTIASSSTLGSLPVYVMVLRQGNVLQAATSTNGTTFTLIPGTNTTMVLPTTSLAGLAVSSGANGAPASATIAHVSINEPSITPQPTSDGSACASGWTCQDIGNPNLVGGQSVSGGTWAIRAAGGDIWGTGDQFHMAWQTVSANATVQARVTATPTTDPNAKAGVMFRGSNAADAAYYAAYLLPDKSIHVQYRDISGFSAQELTNSSGSLPQYLEVARSGTTYTTYISTNGSTWTPLSGSTVSLPNLSGSLIGGLAVTSHNSTGVGSATFTNVAIGTSAPAPPDLCPTGWTCQDIGFPTPAGDQVYSSGNWTITSGGGDIWGDYDELRLVSQTLTGNGSVSAQVTGQSASGDWAKAGPMLRLSNDPQAPYYAAFVTPSHGVVVQWRSQQGGETGQVATSGTAPIYLKVARSGTSLSAYTSSNGSTWTLIPNSTVTITSLGGTTLAGLAADSYNTVNTNTTTWSNVVITGNTGATGIPAPWQNKDIGSPTPAGSTSYANGTFTVKGGGTDIWGTADQSQYVYQTVSGDGTFVARVTSQTDTDPWAKAGLMFKAAATPGSPYAAVMVTPGNGVHLQANFNQDQGGVSYSFPNTWLKLTRDGSLFTAYVSSDGTNWVRVGQMTLNLPYTATIGLFVNAHNGGTALGTATFSDVSFTPTGGGPVPSPWQSTEIGNPGLPGSSSYANGTFTVKGSGSDIWGTTDQLQFMYEPIGTTGTIIADLNSLTNTDPWAKAGVMVKASTVSGSNYAMLAATPGNELHMQYDFTGDIAGGSYSFPNAWLKLTRNGNTITTYASPDGQSWKQVGATTVNLPATALIGLFVDAHDNNQALATAQFTSVSVTQP